MLSGIGRRTRAAGAVYGAVTMARHQDHDPLVAGPGQRVEYHTNRYYDGWVAVPEEFKGNGWVLIWHETEKMSSYHNYHFQRLIEDTMNEEPKDRRIEDRPPAEQSERMAQTDRIELIELRNQVKALVEAQSKAVVTVEAPIDQAAPVMSIEMLRDRDEFIQSVINNFFRKGIHIGEPFPGAKKDGKPILMLYKAGAEWFGSAFGVRPNYIPLDEIVETGEMPRVFYRYRCDLVSIRTGQIVGQAEGLCSSEETKYKYRIQNYKCPSCGEETIMRSRKEWGGGWYCNKNKGGCGAKYEKGEATIENQPEPGRVLNTEVLDQAHTIMAMAQKRAYVLALRAAFGLDAYIQFYEGVEEPEEYSGATVESTATIKEDVPEKVKQFNERVKDEEKSTPESAETGNEPEMADDPLVDVTWTRNRSVTAQMVSGAGELWKISGAHLYNRVARALVLPEGDYRKRDDLLTAIAEHYTGSKDDARALLKAYKSEESAS